MDKSENKDIFDYLNNVSIPVILIVIFVLIVIHFMVASLGNKTTINDFVVKGLNDTSSGGNNSMLLGAIGVLLIGVAILLIFQYVLNYKIFEQIKDFFVGTTSQVKDKIESVEPAIANILPMPEITGSDVGEIFNKGGGKDQVFNVPGNYYGYEDAKAVCSAYGARLAKYGEVESAYKKGGEWCNYGWSDGQMALFPTQQKTYDVLQTKKGHENDCGRPGINGGYMANPALKFGVNCYGKKPAIKPEEADLMKDTTPYPITMEDINFQNKVDYWKDKVNDILVAPFNYKNWSA
jgi:hypothetical protein